ncbi:isoprenylcysteine carboxyl methyltransferase family protein, partial [Bacillus sp. JJ1474]
MLFTIFITVTILQRIVELIIAKKNERFMKSQGALEFGQSHYPFIVAVHSLFFVSYILEVSFVGHEVSSYWPILFPLFLLTQAGRIWALKSLGPYWNTKIIVLPNARIIRKGPYRFFKHPNYIIVSAEFLIIPLMFEAYITTALFTIMNIIILAIRIPAEENALKKLTA